MKGARRRLFEQIEKGFTKEGRKEQIFTYRRSPKIDFRLASNAFSKYLADRLSELSEKSRRLFTLEILVTVSNGQSFTSLPIDFGATFGVRYSPKDLAGFSWGRIWAEIGELLTHAGLISGGSARFIRAHYGNSHRRIADWLDKLPKGEKVKWRHSSEYFNMEKVELVNLEIKTYLVRK